MPRSIVVGNGNALVAFDADYSIRDIFHPQVGLENHTAGNLCRTGFYLDGRFTWLNDPGWKLNLGYAQDTLVTDVTARHDGHGVTVHFTDYVDMARDWLFRNLEVRTDQTVGRVVVFFHYDWFIKESDLGCTTGYDPLHRALIAYKKDRYFLLGGTSASGDGIDSWANGKKGGDRAGTWLDAEDGELGRNLIEQGAVDSTIAFVLGEVGPRQPGRLTHWVCLGADYKGVTEFGQDLILKRGEATYRTRTLNYWTIWSGKSKGAIADNLGPHIHQLYRRSLLTIRTQCDNRGAFTAANDYDITKFARDTYSYVWPRDGALIATALNRAGHEDITREFFEFCQRVERWEGDYAYFQHKYTPDGLVGSSWHPRADQGGNPILAIQEDETGLVLWALWQHFEIHGHLDFAARLYSTLVLRSARFLAAHLDSATGLPKPSWDLWEERWGVHAFTIGAVWGGLDAARRFAALFGDGGERDSFHAAQERLREAADRHLYRPELGRFARRLMLDGSGGVEVDAELDSALYGLWRFGMYPPDDPRIVSTMEAVRDQLSNRGETGGIARYRNDYYFQVDGDIDRVPGNPWFICTLWLAQWYIATATRPKDLERARRIIDWVAAHALQGGLLSEQLDPHSGAPLSVSPLTWSHAELVLTVEDYVAKLESLRAAPPRRKAAARPAPVRRRSAKPR